VQRTGDSFSFPAAPTAEHFHFLLDRAHILPAPGDAPEDLRSLQNATAFVSCGVYHVLGLARAGAPIMAEGGADEPGASDPTAPRRCLWPAVEQLQSGVFRAERRHLEHRHEWAALRAGLPCPAGRGSTPLADAVAAAKCLLEALARCLAAVCGRPDPPAWREDLFWLFLDATYPKRERLVRRRLAREFGKAAGGDFLPTPPLSLAGEAERDLARLRHLRALRPAFNRGPDRPSIWIGRATSSDDEEAYPEPQEDPGAFRPATELLRVSPPETYKALSRVLKEHPEIRRRKPSPQRLEVHLGDWYRVVTEEAARDFAAGGVGDDTAWLIAEEAARLRESRRRERGG
jgi:hypothetical protein